MPVVSTPGRLPPPPLQAVIADADNVATPITNPGFECKPPGGGANSTSRSIFLGLPGRPYQLSEVAAVERQPADGGKREGTTITAIALTNGERWYYGPTTDYHFGPADETNVINHRGFGTPIVHVVGGTATQYFENAVVVSPNFCRHLKQSGTLVTTYYQNGFWAGQTSEAGTWVHTFTGAVSGKASTSLGRKIFKDWTLVRIVASGAPVAAAPASLFPPPASRPDEHDPALYSTCVRQKISAFSIDFRNDCKDAVTVTYRIKTGSSPRNRFDVEPGKQGSINLGPSGRTGVMTREEMEAGSRERTDYAICRKEYSPVDDSDDHWIPGRVAKCKLVISAIR